ncbi:SAM-dependent methyltransferase [Paenibacillus swuensis]|uniref:SAM-dependent methyltransferase n=1 Tax=Paenibacillus swuensis TaxID=1178515 RepID=A0A172TIM5_9BACL|nr:SAM-dependent methyltransferase [Paenibacillus swuensis]ANE46643.1 SAM-dependent methyltransferase [Paenibacillus swuensis]
MEELKPLASLLSRVFRGGGDEALVQAVLSQVRRSEPDGITKITIKPVELKGSLHYQFHAQQGPKVLHENLTPTEAEARCNELFQTQFRQALIRTTEAEYQVLISKKFKVNINTKSTASAKPVLTHNRKKNYVLEEGTPVPFLVELGIMNETGKVLAAKYDKFRQINRFLEMIRDVVPSLPQEKGRTLNIVDFGCGKSYLTFALYYYLKEIEGLNINVIGLDLKEDVITHCSTLAERFGYEDLHFLVGDISQYNGLTEADMVVTLHACDTATDAALEKAVRWNASVILSVPCCQHELFAQVRSEVLSPMLNHGIIKERFAALATDSIRAQLLELVGYRTQILEFIDMEHTPKNLLIRAVRGERTNTDKLAQSYREFVSFLHAKPYLERALADILEPLWAQHPSNS